MNMRNLLKPSDFVMPMPIGIHLTLQYNVSGNLEKVYTGFDSERVDKTNDMMDHIIHHKTAPAKLHITKETTWVKGVLYTGAFVEVSGVLPKSAESLLLAKFIDNPDSFNFFAATIESTSALFTGVTSVRQTLAMAKFKILPGWLAPAGVSNEVVNGWVNSPVYTFIPIVTDYVVFRNTSVSIYSAHLVQKIVESVNSYTDFNGFLCSRLKIKDTDTLVYVNYSETVKHNIVKGSVIIQDTEQNIIYSKCPKRAKTYDTIITCSCCGRQYVVPKTDTVICPNEHCSSRLMPSIKQFISVLHMPVYEDKLLEDKVKKNQVTCIPDLFLLPEYSELHLSTTISALLRALVPISLIPRDDVFVSLSIACSNNERTFRYYVENLYHISSDLNIKHVDLNKLVKWLQDGCNVSDICTLLNSINISLVASEKKFDGAPIFRNKTICLTGTFIRGSMSEIAAILHSYSAKVVFQFTNIVDCVLVGGTNENIDGKMVRDAKALNKAVMSEDVFFKKYEIDSDISSNLV